MTLLNRIHDFFHPDKNYWALDIETDGLNATRVWCIVAKNIITAETKKFYGKGLEDDFTRWAEGLSDPVWVGHNLLSFDLPTLNRLLTVHLDLSSCVDTLVLSYLGNPARIGGHSLQSWGQTLGFPKIDFQDWGAFSLEMLEYCERDVDVNIKVYLRLIEEMEDFSELSAWIEHRARLILDEQKVNGVWFNEDAAIELRDRLREREAELGEVIHKVFPPKLKVRGTYDYRTKSDGTPYASYLRHVERYEHIKFNRNQTRYRTLEYEPFNIGSPVQRVERLLDLGWKPKKFTKKGNPSVDEESLVAFAKKSGNEAVQAMSEWLVCNGRANMLENWLGKVDPDSRIRGTVMSCGATTRRMKHSGPNTANIPGLEAPYGTECRALWGVNPALPYWLVGCDAMGLEGRVLVHYLDNPLAAAFFLDGDPHTSNAEAVGHPRRTTKTLFYAFMYGATDKKLGSIVGKGVAEGARIREILTKNVPGLEALVKSIRKEYKENNGWLETIDGGYVLCTSPHAALNYKLQSAGAIFMKVGAEILRNKINKNNLDVRKVLDVHDEWQFEAHKDHAEQLGKLMKESMQQAGVALGFRIDMDGDYAIGQTWVDTH